MIDLATIDKYKKIDLLQKFSEETLTEFVIPVASRFCEFEKRLNNFTIRTLPHVRLIYFPIYETISTIVET